MSLTDAERESVIGTLAMLSRAHGESRAIQHYWFELMREEIARRSPEQVAAMERERGLAKQIRGAA